MTWSPPTSFSPETSPGVQHPNLGSLAQEGHRPIGVSPEEGHKHDKDVFYDRVGVIWLGEEKIMVRICSTFQYLKGATRAGEGFLQGHVVSGQGGKASN